MTSSPGPTSAASRARCSAVVPLFSPKQWLEPRYSAKAASNRATAGPRTNCASSSTTFSADRISWPRARLWAFRSRKGTCMGSSARAARRRLRVAATLAHAGKGGWDGKAVVVGEARRWCEGPLPLTDLDDDRVTVEVVKHDSVRPCPLLVDVLRDAVAALEAVVVEDDHPAADDPGPGPFHDVSGGPVNIDVDVAEPQPRRADLVCRLLGEDPLEDLDVVEPEPPEQRLDVAGRRVGVLS